MVYEYTKPRAPIAAMYSSPGPCHALPGLTGQPNHDPRSVHNKGPAYPFGVRHGKMKDECSPGPAYQLDGKIYRDGRDGTPHYSLYSRRADGKMFKTPGPGAYQPESAGQTAHFRHPAYSFGSRTAQRRSDKTPGPNSYNLDSMLSKTVRSGKRQAATFTFTGKSKVGSFCEDLARTPGPGAYSVTQPNIYKQKPAAYSMTSRNPMPGDSTKKPGPGAHSPERVPDYNHKRAAPKFSFGIRHSQYEAPLIVDCHD